MNQTIFISFDSYSYHGFDFEKVCDMMIEDPDLFYVQNTRFSLGKKSSFGKMVGYRINDPYKEMIVLRKQIEKRIGEKISEERIREKEEIRKEEEGDSCVLDVLHASESPVSSDAYVEGESKIAELESGEEKSCVHGVHSVDSMDGLVLYKKPQIFDRYEYETEGYCIKKTAVKEKAKVQIRKSTLKVKKVIKKKKRKGRSVLVRVVAPKVEVQAPNVEKVAVEPKKFDEIVGYREKKEGKFVWVNVIFGGICVPMKKAVEDLKDKEVFDKERLIWRKKDEKIVTGLMIFGC